MKKGVKKKLKKKRISRKTKRFLIIIGILTGIILIVGGILFMSEQISVSNFTPKFLDSFNFFATTESIDDEVKNRTHIDELRNTDTIRLNNSEIGDDLAYKSYNSTTKEILIEDKDYNLVIKMKLNSPYLVSGLVGSPDTKVADFLLSNWSDSKTNLIDTINFYDVKDNYKPIDKNFRFKWENITKRCVKENASKEICFDEFDWIEFEILDELPHKNINISLWANTVISEKIEWVFSVEGFVILEWAAWDISTLAYLRNFNSKPYEDSANGLFWKPDGSKMYILGGVGDNITEFNVADNWNVSDAVYFQSSVNLQASNPQGLFIRADGEKLYHTDEITGDIFEYDLGTAWDISTLTNIRSNDIFGDGVFTGTPFFKPDGKKVYICESATGYVHEFNLSTAWNIANMIEVQQFELGDVDLACWGISLKSDGTKLIFGGQLSDAVHEYDLSEAWNITSASFVQSKSVIATTPRLVSIFIKADGTKLYTTDLTADDIDEYDMEAVGILPNVTINQPINKTYTTKIINFNVTALDEIGMDDCNYTLTNGVTNYTMANVTTSPTDWTAINTTMTEGGHESFYHCWDTDGDLNSSESVSFFIDSIKPDINITFPNNNTNWSNVKLNVNYSRSDTNLGSCWYSNDTYLVNVTLASCGNLTGINWSESQHNVTIWANDTLGNENSSSVSFWVDTIDPLIRLKSPVDYYNSSSKGSQKFSWNISDEGGIYPKNTTFLFWNSTDDLIHTFRLNHSGNSPHYQIDYLSYSIPYDGNFTWNVLGCDWAGNCNYSLEGYIEGNRTISRDTVPPTITAPANASLIYPNELDVIFTATDTGVEVNGSTWAVNDSTNFNINNTGGLKNNTILSVGVYLINISVNDTIDNLNSTMYRVEVNGTSNLNLSFSNTTAPITFKTIFQEGEDFWGWLNWTDELSQSINDSFGECNITSVNGLEEVESTNDNFTICGTGCDYSTYSENFTLETTTGAVMDIGHALVCNEQLQQQDAEVNISCNDGATSYFETRSGAGIPLCSVGTSFVTVNTSVCIGVTKINVSVTYEGIFNRRKRILDLTLDREYLNHTSSSTEGEVIFNDTLQLWQTNHTHEYYAHGLKTIFANCTHNTDSNYDNSGTEIITISNAPPQILDSQMTNNLGTFVVNGTLASPNIYGYVGGQWNWSISIVDDDVFNHNETWYNSSGDVLYSMQHLGQAGMHNTSDGLFINFATENTYNLTVWANDTNSNFTARSFYFNITDITPPDINIVTPNNSTYWSNVNLDVNFTRSDDVALSSCWYSNDTYAANSTPDATCNNITSVVWSEGQHNVTIWANDSFGNEGSDSVTFTIDTTPPTFDNLQNHTQEANNTFSFDLDASDTSGIDTFALNQTTNFTINANTGVIANFSSLDLIFVYWLNVSVNDTLDNLVSGIFYINITTVPVACAGINDTRVTKRIEEGIYPYVQLCYGLEFK